MAISDGMGGHRAGAIAAKMTVDQLFLYYQLPQRGFQPRRAVEQLLKKASQAVLELGDSSEAHRRMGATATALLFDPEARHFLLAQVGDSPAYHFRGDKVRPFMAPHVEEETGHLNARIGMRGKLPVHVVTGEVFPGDRFVLCTDGVFTAMEEYRFASMMLPPTCVEEALGEVMTSARLNGKDNSTVLVVDVAGP